MSDHSHSTARTKMVFEPWWLILLTCMFAVYPKDSCLEDTNSRLGRRLIFHVAFLPASLLEAHVCYPKYGHDDQEEKNAENNGGGAV